MTHIAPHPELHSLFETLGYALGFAVYRRARRESGDVLSLQQRWLVISAAVVGALVGSRLLAVLQQMPRRQIALQQLFVPGAGKTIVGGLLVGWIGVEVTKKLSGIQSRTGDLFAVPLCVGIAVGRIGCFLAGLADDTYGNPTQLPWGVDFGDGIARHPTQLYEIVFLGVLAIALARIARRPHENGLLFRVFLGAYLAWRLVVDFLKPEPLVHGMSWIQWACGIGLTWLFMTWRGEREVTRPYEQ